MAAPLRHNVEVQRHLTRPCDRGSGRADGSSVRCNALLAITELRKQKLLDETDNPANLRLGKLSPITVKGEVSDPRHGVKQ